MGVNIVIEMTSNIFSYVTILCHKNLDILLGMLIYPFILNQKYIKR